jgi:hypothetical protein
MAQRASARDNGQSRLPKHHQRHGRRGLLLLLHFPPSRHSHWAATSCRVCVQPSVLLPFLSAVMRERRGGRAVGWRRWWGGGHVKRTRCLIFFLNIFLTHLFCMQTRRRRLNPNFLCIFFTFYLFFLYLLVYFLPTRSALILLVLPWTPPPPHVYRPGAGDEA